MKQKQAKENTEELEQDAIYHALTGRHVTLNTTFHWPEQQKGVQLQFPVETVRNFAETESKFLTTKFDHIPNVTDISTIKIKWQSIKIFFFVTKRLKLLANNYKR